jgi:hypothetical protein
MLILGRALLKASAVRMNFDPLSVTSFEPIVSIRAQVVFKSVGWQYVEEEIGMCQIEICLQENVRQRGQPNLPFRRPMPTCEPDRGFPIWAVAHMSGELRDFAGL